LTVASDTTLAARFNEKPPLQRKGYIIALVTVYAVAVSYVSYVI